MKYVYYDRIISFQMVFPGFFSNHLQGKWTHVTKRYEKTVTIITITSWSLLTLSGLPSASFNCIYGFFLILFKSSCNPSNRKAKSSWQSCCWYPENWGAKRPTCVCKTDKPQNQIDRMSQKHSCSQYSWVSTGEICQVKFVTHVKSTEDMFQ